MKCLTTRRWRRFEDQAGALTRTPRQLNLYAAYGATYAVFTVV